MKKEELTKVFALAKALWNTFNIPKEKIELAITSGLWFELLHPYDYEVIKVAMIEFAKKSDFANISKIADECANIVGGDIYNADVILKEIRSAMTFYEAREKFEKLSPIAKQVVGAPSQLAQWATMDVSTINSVVMSNLRKVVNAKIELAKKNEFFKNNNLQLTGGTLRRLDFDYEKHNSEE